MELFIGLLGAVIGGLLVLIGQVHVRRSEERQQWSNQLLSSAADVHSTYGAARSALIGARKMTAPMPSDAELFYSERNRKWSYFAMTPGAEPLMEHLDHCAKALQKMISSFDADDETFDHANRGLLDALQQMQNSVRSEVERRGQWFLRRLAFSRPRR